MIKTTVRAFGAAQTAPKRTSVAKMISHLLSTARQRRALGRLDSDQLSDLGLSTRAAQREARRPFWDAPKNWRC